MSFIFLFQKKTPLKSNIEKPAEKDVGEFDEDDIISFKAPSDLVETLPVQTASGTEDAEDGDDDEFVDAEEFVQANDAVELLDQVSQSIEPVEGSKASMFSVESIGLDSQTDPFQPKKQLMNSPLPTKKVDVDADPFNPKSQLKNSPLKLDMDNCTSIEDESLPFEAEVEQQSRQDVIREGQNDPVKAKIKTDGEFKPDSQLGNSSKQGASSVPDDLESLFGQMNLKENDRVNKIELECR